MNSPRFVHGADGLAFMAASAAVLAGALAHASPPTITAIGTLPGGTYTRAAAVTQDGQVVTGIADIFTDKFSGDRAFRWTEQTGTQSLGTPSGLPWSAGNSIGGAGNAIAGNAANRAFRWTPATGMQNLGTLPGGTLSIAYAISADGSVVVGSSNAFTGFWAFRWTPATGMQNLGALPGGTDSTARGITPDGLIIVGSSSWAGSGSRAFRWTAPGGFQNLGTLPGGGNSHAYAVTPDGSTVVGTSEWSGAGWRATRWSGWTTPTTLNLGTPPGATDTLAMAVNADGQSIVGYAIYPFGRRAFLWMPGTLMVDLNSYLPAVGLPLTGWVLEEARGISADGSVIVGHGTFNGQQRGFVLRNVPCPSVPVIIADPTSRTTCPGGDAQFSVQASSPSPPTYLWRWRTVGDLRFRDVLAGPNGTAGPGPRFVAGPNVSTATLQITSVAAGPDLEFLVVVSNPCGAVASAAALLRVCPADWNCDDVVDFNDFLAFLNDYNASDPRADLNGDSIVDFNDFLEFLNLYNTPC